ncbi:hypothetical protein H6F93_04240 [Leptolyngbya sp. FACHB-671]|uniref:hypothetical protein n=1 Tax=Leptolyngbya sp. FACHB-671 TaxID=2692812 RepID=UPI001682EBC1|nr:hypothetical protein [Leptolyngbya sp. FACHB-671]MBD2066741.1 hypothetical protein [Leptolyngbya sp. FACHB-671]
MKESSRVLVIAAEELRSRGIGYGSAAELTFEEKQFKRVLSLRKLFHKVATDYCERESKAGRFCLLVEDETLFTVWQTEKLLEPIRNQPSKLDAQVTETSFHDQLNQSLGTKRLNLPLPSSQPPVRNLTDIEPWIVERCQQALSYYVGAIASVYVQETLDKFPQITYHRLINELATKIPDPQQAEEFWQQVLTLITAPAKQKDSRPQRDRPLPTQSLPKQLPAQETKALPNAPYQRTYRGIAY